LVGRVFGGVVKSHTTSPFLTLFFYINWRLMRNIHLDTFIGLLMLVVSGYFYSLTQEMPPEPAEFPKIVLIILMIFSLVIMSKGILLSIRAKKKGLIVEQYFDKIRGPMVVYFALCIYVVLIELLGFFASTTIASAFFMLLFGMKSYTKLFLVLIGINVFIYLLFVWQLKIVLPSGVLI